MNQQRRFLLVFITIFVVAFLVDTYFLLGALHSPDTDRVPRERLRLQSERFNFRVPALTVLIQPTLSSQAPLTRVPTSLLRRVLPEELPSSSNRVPSITVCLRFHASQAMLRATIVNETTDMMGGRGDIETCGITMEWNPLLKQYSFRSLWGTYLAIELNGDVSFDRLWKRSFEHWSLKPMRPSASPPLYYFVSAQGKYLTYKMGHRSHRAFTELDSSEDSLMEIWTLGVPHETVRARTMVDASKATRPIVKKVLMVTTMKPKKMWNSKDEEIQRRSMLNWQRLKSFLRVIVAIDDVETAQIVRSYGHEVDDATEINSEFHQPTYRGMFQKGLRSCAVDGSEVVMFSNSDILYDESLVKSLQFIARFVDCNIPNRVGEKKEWLIVGRRINVLLNHSEAESVESFQSWRAKGSLFQDDAQDYFVVSGGAFDWSSIPPMVVGGIAFDNFLVSKGIDTRGVHVFDASATITALHQNMPERNLFHSHTQKKSEYNSRLAHEAGGWRHGKTSLAPYITVRIPGTEEIALHERGVVVCQKPFPEGPPCYVHHMNQLLNTAPPNDAFSRPFEYQHN